MEDVKAKQFLSIISNDGSGEGVGCGDEDGSGYGIGYSFCCGDDSGSNYGEGYSLGFGYSDGHGYGSNFGVGYGDGHGYGSGYGCDIKTFCGEQVLMIDSIPTIIRSVHNNLAKGFILNNDLTLESCYIAKHDNMFAHGETIQDAMDAVNKKVLEDMDSDEVIDKFFEHFTDPSKKYPAKDFFEWHHYLTGSCEMGRKAFVQNGRYDLEHDTFTVQEFIDITRNAYGKDVILQLEEALKERI